jgi:hypothetical protein
MPARQLLAMRLALDIRVVFVVQGHEVHAFDPHIWAQEAGAENEYDQAAETGDVPFGASACDRYSVCLHRDLLALTTMTASWESETGVCTRASKRITAPAEGQYTP